MNEKKENILSGGISAVIIDAKEKDDGTISVSISDGVVIRVVKRSVLHFSSNFLFLFCSCSSSSFKMRE